jgi:hypothetical protein
MALLRPVKKCARTALREAVKPAALLVLALLTAWPVQARLLSSRAQEGRMIAIALRISEQWYPKIPAKFKDDEFNAREIDARYKQLAGMEGGIFKDLNLLSDLAPMFTYGRFADGRFLAAIDQYDSAADYLDTRDRVRYYAAKIRLHQEIMDFPQQSTGVRIWMDRLILDCQKAARCGFDVDKALKVIEDGVEKYRFTDVVIATQRCRLQKGHAAWAVEEVVRLHNSRKVKQARDVAFQAVRDVAPDQDLCKSDCIPLDEPARLKCYDTFLIKPLCAHIGASREELILAVAERYWQYSGLMVMLLPRLKTPSSRALALFEKTHDDQALQGNKLLAQCEVGLWKKAGKLKAFKAEYPQRFKLAIRK